MPCEAVAPASLQPIVSVPFNGCTLYPVHQTPLRFSRPDFAGGQYRTTDNAGAGSGSGTATAGAASTKTKTGDGSSSAVTGDDDGNGGSSNSFSPIVFLFDTFYEHLFTIAPGWFALLFCIFVKCFWDGVLKTVTAPLRLTAPASIQ